MKPHFRNLALALFAALGLLALTGCESVTLNILSNNNVLSNRATSTGTGDPSTDSEGGGAVDLQADVSAMP